MQRVSKHPVRASEYLALERASDTKHELVNGEIVAMAGASVVHNLVAANLTRRLHQLLEARPCFVLTSDQRVHVPTTGLFTYPDVTVVCGRLELHPEDDHTLVNPKVIVEVLSESTEAYDRGAKFAHYRSIPSLEEYVLVSTHVKQVEHFRRQSPGQWMLSVFAGDDPQSVSFPALDGSVVSLVDIYAKVEMITGAS